MLINCLYGDNELADIIFISDSINDIEKLQNDFLSWVFNNPSYMKDIKGIMVCAYDTKDFVDWINSKIEYKGFEPSKIIEKNARVLNSNNQCLYF